MKRIICMVVLTLLLCGCTNKETERKEIMEKYGHQYYNSYAVHYGIDEYTVSLRDLRKANKDLKQKYVLDSLENCNETTSVTFKINKKEVKTANIKLNC